MQLLSASGELKSVSARSSPIGGIDVHQIRAPGAQAIPLVRLPSGEMRMLAISRIYRTNPYIMACSHLLARNLSSIPVRTYITEADGSRRRLRSDKPKQGPGRPEAGIGLDLLARKPAPRISRRKIIFKSVIDICAFGNSLQFFNWGDYGPNQLWPIPWRRVMVDVIDPITIDHWDIWGAAGRKSLSPEQCIHITWGDDPESPIGVSPIESLQYTIALHNAIDRHLVSFYGNAARPSGLLKLSQAPKDNQIEQIREQFRQLYTAPESAGNVIITSGDYQPIAEATGVPTLVELVYKSRAEILAVYGVDPPMIGDYSQAVKSNMQEARGKFVRDTLGPWATLHEDEWWAQMISQNPLWDYHWWQFDLDERLRPDLMERAKAYALLGDTLTTNERRRKENVEDLPFPEADTVWMGSGKIPLGIGTPTTTSDLEPEPEFDPSKFPELQPGDPEPGDPEPGDEPEDPDDIDADPDDEGDD